MKNDIELKLVEEPTDLQELVQAVLKDQIAFNNFHHSYPKVEWLSLINLKEYVLGR